MQATLTHAVDLETFATVGTGLGVLLAAVLSKLDSRKARKASEHVRELLATTQQDRKIQLNEIHALVNGEMMEQRRQLMEARLRLANLTDQETDWVAYQAARLAWEGQMAKQEYLVGEKLEKQKQTRKET